MPRSLSVVNELAEIQPEGDPNQPPRSSIHRALSAMEKFERLVRSVRTLSPQGTTSIRGIPDREDWYVCTVAVAGVILAESSAGPLDEVIDEIMRKIKAMSTRMRAVLETPSGELP